jgi:hypothetical protein
LPNHDRDQFNAEQILDEWLQCQRNHPYIFRRSCALTAVGDREPSAMAEGGGRTDANSHRGTKNLGAAALESGACRLIAQTLT